MSACELSARVTPGDAKCEQYRRAGSASCMTCEVGPSIETVRDDMSGSLCKAEGCEKKNFVEGYCAGHAKENGHGAALQARYDKQEVRRLAAKKPLAAAKATSSAAAAEKVIEHVKKAAKVQVKEVVEPAVVTRALPPGCAMTFFDGDVVELALDEAYAAKKQEWLDELSGLSPMKTLAKAADMVAALEGLVY